MYLKFEYSDKTGNKQEHNKQETAGSRWVTAAVVFHTYFYCAKKWSNFKNILNLHSDRIQDEL